MKLLGSAPGFLRIGVITADLRGDGTVTNMREEWIIADIRGDQGLNATFNQYCRERIKLVSGWLRFAVKVGNFSSRGEVKVREWMGENYLKDRGV